MRPIDADEILKHIPPEEMCSRFLVANAPTIELERKKGKWIDKSGGIEGAWNYCSVCGEQAIDLYDFCPNCGADMRGAEK